MDNVTFDLARGTVTHLNGELLPEPIPLMEWAKMTQDYTILVSEYIDTLYNARKVLEQTILDKNLGGLQQVLGSDILDRLQADRGFTIALIKPTDAWLDPVIEGELPEVAKGTVNLFDLRRVEIIAVVTKLLSDKIPTGNHFVENKDRAKYALTLDTIAKVLQKKLCFETNINLKVKGVSSTKNLTSKHNNFDVYYLDNLRDILLQEGWRSVNNADGGDETMLPAGAGLPNCGDCPHNGKRDHPFWRK